MGIHVALLPRDRPAPKPEELARYFAADSTTGSRVSGGAAEAWTDFREHGDGFGRRLIRDISLTPRQAGRLAQRLLEIGTYQLLALLTLPVAREASAPLGEADRELEAIIAEMQRMEHGAAERTLLERLDRKSHV